MSLFFKLRMFWTFTLVIFLSNLLSAGIDVSIQAAPVKFTGPCPITITFVATISVDKAMKIKYQFVRSDGKILPSQILEFFEPGTKSVKSLWTISHTYSGWQAMKILSPQQKMSEKALFDINCRTSRKKTQNSLPQIAQPNWQNYPDKPSASLFQKQEFEPCKNTSEIKLTGVDMRPVEIQLVRGKSDIKNSFVFSVLIVNQGDKQAPPNKLNLLLKSQFSHPLHGAEFYFNYEIPSIEGNGCLWIHQPVDNLWPAAWTIIATIDYDNIIIEAVENNNTISKKFLIATQ